MSEEKLYVVKNDEGKYWDMNMGPGWSIDSGTAITNSYEVLAWANNHGGHVVTLIEEPEKLVLTKEQAKIVKGAHNDKLPACYISSKSDDEELLMKAYVNGYTVAKDKKYNVKVPHTKEAWYYKTFDGDLLTICPEDKKLRGTFTEAEIEHYGLQDCEKEEVTDDEQ